MKALIITLLLSTIFFAQQQDCSTHSLLTRFNNFVTQIKSENTTLNVATYPGLVTGAATTPASADQSSFTNGACPSLATQANCCTKQTMLFFEAVGQHIMYRELTRRTGLQAMNQSAQITPDYTPGTQARQGLDRQYSSCVKSGVEPNFLKWADANGKLGKILEEQKKLNFLQTVILSKYQRSLLCVICVPPSNLTNILVNNLIVSEKTSFETFLKDIGGVFKRNMTNQQRTGGLVKEWYDKLWDFSNSTCKKAMEENLGNRTQKVNPCRHNTTGVEDCEANAKMNLPRPLLRAGQTAVGEGGASVGTTAGSGLASYTSVSSDNAVNVDGVTATSTTDTSSSASFVLINVILSSALMLILLMI